MKNSKKGISLIVLVITIIVIIILAAAVILTLNKNNPIDNSKNATFNNDAAEVRSALALYVSNFMANDYNHNGPFEMKSNASGDSISNLITIGDTDSTAEYSTAEKDTKYSTTVSWSDLGFDKKPVSIKSATYDTKDGHVEIKAAQGYGGTPS